MCPHDRLNTGITSEKEMCDRYRKWALQGLHNALDSSARDFMRFDIAGQQLVNAYYIALAFNRAPWLWENLDASSKTKMIPLSGYQRIKQKSWGQ
ncbi:DUF2264 domain-containing protein [Pedobacter borealis]|uniref:DUF2264 domain-containing protein n=1 Tax=Pedobacter borealis TaxID=475254 RepID=UPI0004939D91|nr:DUF2264 domain-containing protein [Pedobacter borealis]